MEDSVLISEHILDDVMFSNPATIFFINTEREWLIHNLKGQCESRISGHKWCKSNPWGHTQGKGRVSLLISVTKEIYNPQYNIFIQSTIVLCSTAGCCISVATCGSRYWGFVLSLDYTYNKITWNSHVYIVWFVLIINYNGE